MQNVFVNRGNGGGNLHHRLGTLKRLILLLAVAALAGVFKADTFAQQLYFNDLLREINVWSGNYLYNDTIGTGAYGTSSDSRTLGTSGNFPQGHYISDGGGTRWINYTTGATTPPGADTIRIGDAQRVQWSGNGSLSVAGFVGNDGYPNGNAGTHYTTSANVQAALREQMARVPGLHPNPAPAAGNLNNGVGATPGTLRNQTAWTWVAEGGSRFGGYWQCTIESWTAAGAAGTYQGTQTHRAYVNLNHFRIQPTVVHTATGSTWTNGTLEDRYDQLVNLIQSESRTVGGLTVNSGYPHPHTPGHWSTRPGTPPSIPATTIPPTYIDDPREEPDPIYRHSGTPPTPPADLFVYDVVTGKWILNPSEPTYAVDWAIDPDSETINSIMTDPGVSNATFQSGGPLAPREGRPSSLTFQNYGWDTAANAGDGAVRPVNELHDGGVIYISSGDVTIKGDQTVQNWYTSGSYTPQWNAAERRWQYNVSLGGTMTGYSYVYFVNNHGLTGGAIRHNAGQLTIRQARFGTAPFPTAVTPSPLPNLGNTAQTDGGAIYSAGGTLILGDVTFLSGSAGVSTTGAGGSGGAIYKLSGTITGESAVNFTNNSATMGGAIFNSATINLWALPYVWNQTFLGNYAATTGGAVYNVGLFEYRGRFIGNYTRITTGEESRGGAIFNSATGRVVLGEVHLQGNRAGWNGSATVTTNTGFGGAIYNMGELYIGRNLAGTPFTGTIISENMAFQGGALYNETGTIRIGADASFGANVADSDGGAIFNRDGTLEFASVTFSSNAADANDGGTANPATGRGGAIYSLRGVITISDNSSFSGNLAARGGAVYIDGGTNHSIATVGFTSNVAKVSGGALFNVGTLRLESATFDRNVAQAQDGGAIYNEAIRGNLTITNSGASTTIFVENTANRSGGAIYNAQSAVLAITGSGSGWAAEFLRNTATTGHGGAIYNTTNSTITLNRVNFQANAAGGGSVTTGLGGAIYNRELGTLNITNGTFSDNTASQGGAIYNYGDEFEGGNTILSDVQFLGNRATHGHGGAIYNNLNADLTITGGSFLRNFATGVATTAGGAPEAGRGGAIYNAGGTTNIKTITISGVNFVDNEARQGGAIYNDLGGIFDLTNVQFEDNKATIGDGGAIYNATGGQLKLNNAIFSANSATQGGAIYMAQGGRLEITGTGVAAAETIKLNTATRGGAIYNAGAQLVSGAWVGGVVDLNRLNFMQNSATLGGGAIYNAVGGTINLTDVSFFENNTAVPSASRVGGAIYSMGATNQHADGTWVGGEININVVDANQTFADPADSIFFSGAGSAHHFLNVDVAGGRMLTMMGGMSSGAGADVEIVQKGAGTWFLRGNHTFNPAGLTNFTLTEGTLLLDRNTVLNLGTQDPADAGNHYTKFNSFTTLAGTTITARVESGLGGIFRFENSLTPPILGANQSIIAADRWEVLGLTTVNANEFIFGKDSIVDFGTLTADAVHGNPFNGLNLFFNTPTATSVIDLDSDIYINVDEVSALRLRDGQYITLMQTNGVFGEIKGKLFMDWLAAPAPGDEFPANLTRMETTTAADIFRGIGLSQDGKELRLMAMDMSSNGILYWSGAVNVQWDRVKGNGTSVGVGNASGTKNWSGTVGGQHADVFLNGDTVWFADSYINHLGVDTPVAAARKAVVLAEAMTVGNLIVTGDGYSFDLTAGGISAEVNLATGAAGNINFGTAIVNQVAQEIKAAGSVNLGLAVRPLGTNGVLQVKDGATIEAGTTITLALGSLLDFTTVGKVDDGSGILTLAALGAITLNSDIKLDVLASSLVGGPSFGLDGVNKYALIDVDARGGVEPMITPGKLFELGGGEVEVGKRTDAGVPAIVYDLYYDKSNAKLYLVGVAAGTQADVDSNGIGLFWTGKDSNNWNNTEENWKGTLANGMVDINTFMNNDSVSFINSPDVVSRTVNIASGGVIVGALTVTGDDYIFNLTAGAGAANPIIKADDSQGTGMIDFGTATLTGLRINAGASGTRGTTIVAKEIESLGSQLEFNLANANTTTDRLLTLDVGGTTTVDVSNTEFHLTNVGLFGIVLIEIENGATFTGREGILESVNGLPVPEFVRSPTSGELFAGLGFDNRLNPTQLLLKGVNASDNSDNLAWTGGENGIWDARTTAAAPHNGSENWNGLVSGRSVEVFLHGDSVEFGTGAARKEVELAGTMTVGDMNVTDTGYIFNLTNGGINATTTTNNTTATGSIDFGSATLTANRQASGEYFGMTNTTISAAGTITIGTATAAGTLMFDLRNPQFTNPMLTLHAADGGTINRAVVQLYTENMLFLLDRMPTTGEKITLASLTAGVGESWDVNNVSAQIWNGTSYVNFIPQRTANGNVYNFVTSNTELAIEAQVADTGNVYWTGANDSNWNTTTKNWEGNMTASGGPVTGFIAKHFMSGDHVKFDDGVLGTPVTNRDIAIQGNVSVGSLEVVGTGLGYSFDFSSSTGITSAGSVNFRDADLVGIKKDTTISAATGNISFAGSANNFDFDLAGAGPGDTMLWLDATTGNVAGVIGGGNINITPLGGGQLDGYIVLVDTDGKGTTTNAGKLFVNNVEYVAERGPAGYIYGLATDIDKTQLLLAFIAANTNSDELRWTGEESLYWNNGAQSGHKNWKGEVGTDGIVVNTFLSGDHVVFGSEVLASKRTVNIAGNLAVGDMLVVGSLTVEGQYRFNIDGGGTTITVTDGGNITFNDISTLGFNVSTIASGNTTPILRLDGEVANQNITVKSIIDVTGAGSVLGNSYLLASSNANNAFANAGPLWINGAAYTAERDSASGVMYALNTSNNHRDLYLNVISSTTNSSDLRWTGRSSGAWDINTSKNWYGTAGGIAVDTFLNGDTVLFANVNETGADIVNKTVTVAQSGVSVGAMTVTGDGYTFNLHLRNSLNDPGNAAIRASGDINLGNAKLNIIGYHDILDRDDYYTIVSTTGGVITTADGVVPAVAIGGGDKPVDFLSVLARFNNNINPTAIEIAASLTWNSTEPTRPAHGNFTIDGEDNFFIVGSRLENKTPNAQWNGQSLTKSGSGTLILTANNTYSGVTTVTAGTLQIGNGATAGSIAGDIHNNGHVIFNRDVYEFTYVAADGTLSTGLDYRGNITGAGRVTQAGAGTLILSGNNTYSGGTTVTNGTLQIGNGGTTGSVAGNIVNNSEVVFNRSDEVTYGGNMSGTGSLEQNGTGTLILTGNNTHEGGTTVSRGTLQIGKINDDGSGGGSGWVAGDIATSSGTHVRFNRAEDLAFNGNITGTGTTTVASGGIYLGEGFSIGGPLFVNSGATFGGSGTVHGPVTVSKNATLAPGGIFSGVGTLTVNNGVSFETNSTYEYNINNGDDTHDLLVVSNSSAEVRIADGAKLAVYGRGTFGDDNDLQVIAANRGQFRDGDGFLDDSVRFDLSGDWGWRFEQVMKNDGLFLSWKGFEKSIGRFGSDNAIRAANGVDRIGPSFGLFDELDGITTAKSMANAFGQLHGEVYASNKIAAAQLQRSFQGLMPNGREYYQGDMPKVWNRWGTLTGGTRNRSSIGTYSAYDLSSTGVTAGIDRIVTRKVLLGGAIGYDYGDQYYKDIRSKEQMDAFRTMVYGSWFNGKYYVDAYGGYTKNYHRTKRSIDIGEFSAVARGKYNDDMASIGGEFGRVYNFREFTLTPSIGLQYLTIAHTPSFSETGGASGDYSANLRVEQSGYDSFRLPIGVKASKLFVGSRNIAWTPEARVSYNYEMMDTSARVWTRFKGHDDVRFAAESGDWGRSSVRVGAGLGAIVSNRFNFRVDYDFESYKHATVHAFEALLGFQW